MRQGRTARENWVLDKRYLLYERVLENATDVTTVTTVPEIERAADEAFRRRLYAALVALELVAPANIREQSDVVGALLDGIGTGGDEAVEQFIGELVTLMHMLRDDLVPKHMR